jgi:cyclic pyranopterin monophosphate synthase
MVAVGCKPETAREATAEGVLRCAPETLRALLDQRTPKGDPLVVAQLAGIQAAKRTADLIPLCHTLPLTAVDVRLEPAPDVPGVRATATVAATARTGVEMEALTAVATALLTLYDMLKGLDRELRLDGIRLLRKTGGSRGDWTAGAD